MCLHSRCLVSPLSPNVSHCLPACVSVLDGASAFLTSCLSLSPHMCACVGWRVRLLKVSSPLLTPSVPLSALSRIVSPHVCLCWMVCLPARGLSACLRLSPHNMRLCWMVCPPSQGLVSPCHLPSFPCFNGVPPFQGLVSPGPPLLPILSHCLPACVHLCWMLCPPSRRLVSELSPIVPTCVPVLDGPPSRSLGFHYLPLSP